MSTQDQDREVRTALDLRSKLGDLVSLVQSLALRNELVSRTFGDSIRRAGLAIDATALPTDSAPPGKLQRLAQVKDSISDVIKSARQFNEVSATLNPLTEEEDDVGVESIVVEEYGG